MARALEERLSQQLDDLMISEARLKSQLWKVQSRIKAVRTKLTRLHLKESDDGDGTASSSDSESASNAIGQGDATQHAKVSNESNLPASSQGAPSVAASEFPAHSPQASLPSSSCERVVGDCPEPLIRNPRQKIVVPQVHKKARPAGKARARIPTKPKDVCRACWYRQHGVSGGPAHDPSKVCRVEQSR